MIFNSLNPKVHFNHFGALPQLRDALKDLLNSTDKRLSSLRMSIVKPGQMRRCQKLWRKVLAMRNFPKYFFNQLRFKKR